MPTGNFTLTINSALAALLALAVCTAPASAAQWAASASNCSSVAPPSAFGILTDEDKMTPSPTSIQILMTMGSITTPALVVCPGVTYGVKVTFPAKRSYTLAASAGTIAGASTICPNRKINSAGASSVGLQLTIPCNAAGTITIKVASVEAGKNSSIWYMQRTTKVNVAPLLLCAVSTCPGAPKLNASTVAGLLTNQISLPAAMQSLSQDVKTIVNANVQQQAAGVMNALQTAVSSVMIQANASASSNVANSAQLMSALAPIAALLSSKTNASNTNPLLGLLSAIGTISTALNGGVAGSSTTGITGSTSSGAANTPVTMNIPQMLQTVKLVGNLLSGGQASTITPSLTGLMESGIGLVSSLVKMVPASGATADTLSMPNIIAFMQAAGGFMGQLSALIPAEASNAG